MKNEPTLWAGSAISRRTSKEIAQQRERNEVALKAMDLQGDRAIAAMDNVSYAVGHAARQIFAVGEGIRTLELLRPDLSPRLNMLGDQHAVATCSIVNSLEVKLRRMI